MRPKIVAGIAAALAAALVIVPAASATGRYTDATGDSGAAPDITGMTVASDTTGQLLFTINVANLPPSPADVQTVLVVDTDLDPNTGAPGSAGGDYSFVVDESDQTYAFERWTGTSWDDAPYATVTVVSRRTGVTISVNRSELGGTSGFNFWSKTVAGDAADYAPDDGLWNYSLASGGPDIRRVLVSSAPSSGPKAGKPFALSPVGLELPPSAEPPVLMPHPDSYACRATLAGRALRGSGKGGCRWQIPAKTRGKAFVVAVTIQYEGASKTLTFKYRVA